MEDKKIIEKLYLLASKLGRIPNDEEINLENGFTISYAAIIEKGITKYSINIREYLYNQNPGNCKQCQSILTFLQRNNKYCSKSCAAIVNNHISPKRRSKYPEKECKCCFSIIKRSGHFCSMKCRNDFMYMERFLTWYYNGKNFKGTHVQIKDFIILIDGYKCLECGIAEYNGKKLTLHLEHINGNAIDNSRENLCLLCPNCHAQTPTYKGRNRGNGTRLWRNEAYKNGKSY